MEPFRLDQGELRNTLSIVGPRLRSLSLGRCPRSIPGTRSSLELIAILCPRLISLQLGLGWPSEAVVEVLADGSTDPALTPLAGSPQVQGNGFELVKARSTRKLLVK